MRFIILVDKSLVRMELWVGEESGDGWDHVREMWTTSDTIQFGQSYLMYVKDFQKD